MLSRKLESLSLYLVYYDLMIFSQLKLKYLEAQIMTNTMIRC